MSSFGLTAARLPRNPPVRLPEPASANPSRPNGVCKLMLLSAMSRTTLGSENGLPVGGGSSLLTSPQLTLPSMTLPFSRTPRATMR